MTGNPADRRIAVTLIAGSPSLRQVSPAGFPSVRDASPAEVAIVRRYRPMFKREHFLKKSAC
jgi:hypothetical protein